MCGVNDFLKSHKCTNVKASRGEELMDNDETKGRASFLRAKKLCPSTLPKSHSNVVSGARRGQTFQRDKSFGM